MEEEFRDVKGFEGLYQVSNLGRVKSLARKSFTGKQLTEKTLKLSRASHGYLTLSLRKNGKQETRNVHQLVAEAFLGHTPCGLRLIVNHINFNTQDNRAENLEIDTQRNNSNQKHLKSSSEYVGVCWAKNRNKWISGIRINGKKKHLGYFTDEVEASEAYQKALNAL